MAATHQNIQLLLAARQGNLVEVQRLLLLPENNAQDNASEALWEAAGAGYLDVVKALLPVSDPKAMNSRAIREAATFKHMDVVKLLSDVSDVDAAFKSLHTRQRFIACDRLSAFVTQETLMSMDEEELFYLPKARARLNQGPMNIDAGPAGSTPLKRELFSSVEFAARKTRV